MGEEGNQFTHLFYKHRPCLLSIVPDQICVSFLAILRPHYMRQDVQDGIPLPKQRPSTYFALDISCRLRCSCHSFSWYARYDVTYSRRSFLKCETESPLVDEASDNLGNLGEIQMLTEN